MPVDEEEEFAVLVIAEKDLVVGAVGSTPLAAAIEARDCLAVVDDFALVAAIVALVHLD